MAVENLELKKTDYSRIMKNVITVSVAFMVHFTAYNGAANLQSSINSESGLGTAALATVYIGLIISSLFLPIIVIKCLGTKWTICLGFVFSMPYLIVQLFPSFYTLIPTALVVGIGAGLFWCAVYTYLAMLAKTHSKISMISAEVLLTRFMGISFMFYNANQIFGNLISSLVLSSGNSTAAVTSLNETMIPILCGSNFLASAHAAEALSPQPPIKMQILTGVLLVFIATAALIVAIGLDSTKRYDEQVSARESSSLALLFVTFKLITEPTQLLLVVINMFIGMEQAFFSASFTASFVSCAVGTGSVGFVMMTFGMFDALGCLLTGYLSKITGRLPLMSVAFIIHVTLLCAMLTWHPHVGENYVLYIIAGLWGFCDSVWLVQITVCYGILFPGREEESFGVNQLWMALGYVVAYILSPYLKTGHQIYVLLAFLVVGMVGYVVVEYQQYRIKNDKDIKKDLCNIKN